MVHRLAGFHLDYRTGFLLPFGRQHQVWVQLGRARLHHGCSLVPGIDIRPVLAPPLVLQLANDAIVLYLFADRPYENGHYASAESSSFRQADLNPAKTTRNANMDDRTGATG